MQGSCLKSGGGSVCPVSLLPLPRSPFSPPGVPPVSLVHHSVTPCVQVFVGMGQEVAEGDSLVVVEAMKMEHTVGSQCCACKQASMHVCILSKC